MAANYQLVSLVLLVTLILGSDSVVGFEENNNCDYDSKGRGERFAGREPLSIKGTKCRKVCEESEITEISERECFYSGYLCYDPLKLCATGLVCCRDPKVVYPTPIKPDGSMPSLLVIVK